MVETSFFIGYEFGVSWRSPAVVIGSEPDAGVTTAAPAARRHSIHSIVREVTAITLPPDNL